MSDEGRGKSEKNFLTILHGDIYMYVIHIFFHLEFCTAESILNV